MPLPRRLPAPAGTRPLCHLAGSRPRVGLSHLLVLAEEHQRCREHPFGAPRAQRGLSGCLCRPPAWHGLGSAVGRGGRASVVSCTHRARARVALSLPTLSFHLQQDQGSAVHAVGVHLVGFRGIYPAPCAQCPPAALRTAPPLGVALLLSSWGGKELDHRAGSLFRQAEAVRALSWGSGDLRPVPAPRAKFAVDQARRSPLCASVSQRRGGGVDVRSRGWMNGGPGGRAGCLLGWAPQVLSVPQFPMCAG